MTRHIYDFITTRPYNFYDFYHTTEYGIFEKLNYKLVRY